MCNETDSLLGLKTVAGSKAVLMLPHAAGCQAMSDLQHQQSFTIPAFKCLTEDDLILTDELEEGGALAAAFGDLADTSKMGLLPSEVCVGFVRVIGVWGPYLPARTALHVGAWHWSLPDDARHCCCHVSVSSSSIW